MDGALDMETVISTHSLTRRLTCDKGEYRIVAGDFNSQPHKEADREVAERFRHMLDFNSQPHKEADFRGTGCNRP